MREYRITAICVYSFKNSFNVPQLKVFIFVARSSSKPLHYQTPLPPYFHEAMVHEDWVTYITCGLVGKCVEFLLQPSGRRSSSLLLTKAAFSETQIRVRSLLGTDKCRQL
ncbi:hypothetical protein ONS96_009075 [Cadophora gregata f. sp. sojae]|nr:hypothetical protein ONS96_009075 [Cadophora gregata f. sp. sojae]